MVDLITNVIVTFVFEIWCWRRLEKINWTDRVRNKEVRVLHRVKEQRNIVRAMKRRKVGWIGHTLGRNCLIKQVIEGKIEGRMEVKGRRGRGCKQLLDDLKEKRILEIERRNTRWHFVENPLWKGLST